MLLLSSIYYYVWVPKRWIFLFIHAGTFLEQGFIRRTVNCFSCTSKSSKKTQFNYFLTGNLVGPSNWCWQHHSKCAKLHPLMKFRMGCNDLKNYLVHKSCLNFCFNNVLTWIHLSVAGDCLYRLYIRLSACVFVCFPIDTFTWVSVAAWYMCSWILCNYSLALSLDK